MTPWVQRLFTVPLKNANWNFSPTVARWRVSLGLELWWSIWSMRSGLQTGPELFTLLMGTEILGQQITDGEDGEPHLQASHPQHQVPLLFSLYTHDCIATHPSNINICRWYSDGRTDLQRHPGNGLSGWEAEEIHLSQDLQEPSGESHCQAVTVLPVHHYSWLSSPPPYTASLPGITTALPWTNDFTQGGPVCRTD